MTWGCHSVPTMRNNGPQVISLAPQSLAQLPPLEFATIAAQAGYSHIGVRTINGTPGAGSGERPCLIENVQQVRALKILLALEDLQVRELEYVTLGPGFKATDCARAIEWGAELGARYLVATGDDSDLARLTDNAAALAKLATHHGMRLMIEFVPWLGINSIGAALALTSALSEHQIGVQIDMLHLFRSGGTAADLAGVNTSLIPYIQLCDAVEPCPIDIAELRRQSSEARCDPGFGDFDLAAVFAALPKNIPISLEVPNRTRVSAAGPLTHAIAIRSATLAMLDQFSMAAPVLQKSSGT
jgi:sugar phosphate isomerase/epimerase